ncbi:hypothetical protein [Sporobacter termitidis]|uniref:hypothetical protein n=1 Tax=Sporobacter termitidis TaxID=44749 RepID=UPI0009336CD6|nr:hypothetical protein [Sporobacter termitidis]
MKRILTRVLLVIVGIAVGVAACLAAYYTSGDGLFEKTVGTKKPAASVSLRAAATNAELTQYAYKVLDYIKAGDYAGLSSMVHPEFGVVFSPYATINLTSNKCFTAAQVGAFAGDNNKYVWGKYDGSGSPIEMTPADYFKKFVFDKDYTLATQIGVDTVIKTGNSLENIKDVFPNIRYVDFHIPGTDANADGLDWSSLRLGFEKYNGELKLTVIVHSVWTV